MDSDCLNLFASNLSYDGIIISTEHKSSLETSLKVLKNEMKFEKLFFWGRIATMGAPYYIVQGIEEVSNINQIRTLFSQDCINWALMNPASDQLKKDIKKSTGMMTGQLGFNVDEQEEGEDSNSKDIVEESENEDTKNNEEEEEEEVLFIGSIILKEETKLTGTIDWIDCETRLVPRGAYIKSITGKILENPLFSGLSFMEAGKLYNYRHFRPAVRMLEKTVLQRADLDRAIDFLDPIVEDIPSDISWCLQYEKGGSIITIKSMLWPGYVFYHIPNTRFFGSLYYGNGIKNLDLPFMI